MTTSSGSASEKVWETIDDEKRRDRFIKRVSVTAWSVTFLLVLILGIVVGLHVVQMVKAVAVGVLPWTSVIGVVMPFVIVLGILSVLIATLSTVGIFLRLRTATLSEIQLRLAALEDMLVTRKE